MNQGVETIIYPVKDINKAKKLFNRLLDTQPYSDRPNYVGYKVGQQEIGLDPNGFSHGMDGPISYFHVTDIRETYKYLLDAGATRLQEVKDVGGGKLTATVKGPEGNVIGLIQMPTH
jgi:predicted enzyme related to lactoylglutathione lyase